MCATSTVSARRGCVEEVQKVEVAGYVLLQTLILLYRLLESSIGLRSPSDQIAFAVRSDCVRRPIRLRPPVGGWSFETLCFFILTMCSYINYKLSIDKDFFQKR